VTKSRARFAHESGLAALAEGVARDLTMPDIEESLDLVAKQVSVRGRSQTVGRSRRGRDLDLVSLGSGPVDILVLGTPHTNEPVSAAAVPELLRILTEAAENGDARLEPFTFHIVPVWDLDGAVLSSGAYQPTPDLLGYHRAFYRPAAAHQPEWAFPLNEGCRVALPEARAIMDVIDSTAPRALISLHNADMASGAYYIAAGAPPALAERLSRLPATCGIPLDRAPADGVSWAETAPGVRVLPYAHQMGAACSLHYAARRHGTIGLMTEAPQWYVTAPLVRNERGWPQRMEALAERAERAITPLTATILTVARQYPACPVAAAALFFLEATVAEIRRCRTAPAPRDPTARQRQRQADWLTLHRMPLRLAGLVLALARPHPCCHPLRDAVRQHAGSTLDTLTAALGEISPPRPVPLHLAVRLEVASVLEAAEFAWEASG
jgi:hypothetical protein